MPLNPVALAVIAALAVFAHLLLPHRWRWAPLLVGSVGLYLTLAPAYALILLLVVGVDYVAGRALEGADGRERAVPVAASLAAHSGALVVFRYYNFAADSLSDGAGRLGLHLALPLLHMAVPLGLAVFSLNGLGYIFDVYRGRQRAERHLGTFALFMLFFPSLIAGPIARAGDLLPELHRERRFEWKAAAGSLLLIAWGLFKIVVVADRISAAIDPVYLRPELFADITVSIVTILYAYQVYCTWSGYADIAVGIAGLFGIRLAPNFRQPYFASSIADFWRRWNITLSGWFREYVWEPLGGDAVPRWRWARNTLMVFVLIGLWHGANWTYVVWGALHAGLLTIGMMTLVWRRRVVNSVKLPGWSVVHRCWQAAFTSAAVWFAWIFFRAPTVTSAFALADQSISGIVRVPYYLSHADLLRRAIHQLHWTPLAGVPAEWADRDWLILGASLALVEAQHLLMEHRDLLRWTRMPVRLRRTAYGGVLVACMVLAGPSVRHFFAYQKQGEATSASTTPDSGAAKRGAAVYDTNCAFCHGADARGGEGGPNLLRSEIVLRDENGNLIAKVVRTGGDSMPPVPLSASETADVAAYLHSFSIDPKNNSQLPPPTILVGDPKAGRSYVEAHCLQCHDSQGDLLARARTLDNPMRLQLVWLTGVRERPSPVSATVRYASGRTLEGRLNRLDDFTVALTREDGVQHVIARRTDDPIVIVRDPRQPHLDLLSTYQDRDIHNVTAYLWSLR